MIQKDTRNSLNLGLHPIVITYILSQKNLEEIQDQIEICAKREKKVQKRNKSLKKEIKVLKRNKSPNRKGKIKVQIEKGSKSPNRKGK